MTVFFDFEWVWPSIFNGIPEPWRQANSGITCPRKDQFTGTSGTDHLVVNDVWSQSNQREIPFLLANDFVTGSKRDEVAEPFGCNGIAI